MAKAGLKIVWEEPPRAGRDAVRMGSHHALAEELKTRPEEWGHILTYTSQPSAASTAALIRAGRSSAWAPPNSFEAVSRKISDKEYRVYARYVGEEP